MITKQQIEQLAEEKLKGSSFFIVDVKVLPGNRIEVYVDGENGIGIKDCVELSRYIEKSLDREAEDFSLEVSSPGATTPLKIGRQYLKHIGRDLEVTLNNGEKIEGTLVETDGKEELVLETTSRENKPIGKGKITVTRTHKIRLPEIKESKIKLKF
jgi:ribosome maturation factor RimP